MLDTWKPSTSSPVLNIRRNRSFVPPFSPSPHPHQLTHASRAAGLPRLDASNGRELRHSSSSSQLDSKGPRRFERDEQLFGSTCYRQHWRFRNGRSSSRRRSSVTHLSVRFLPSLSPVRFIQQLTRIIKQYISFIRQEEGSSHPPPTLSQASRSDSRCRLGTPNHLHHG